MVTAVTGSAYTGNDLAGVFLAVISPDASSQVPVRTSPYVPYALAFAPDGISGRQVASWLADMKSIRSTS